MRLEVAVDCSDLELMTDFWSQVLRYAPVGDSDDRFDVPDRVYCSLVDPSGIGPRLVLQRVAERRSGKNRLHLDIHVPTSRPRLSALLPWARGGWMSIRSRKWGRDGFA